MVEREIAMELEITWGRFIRVWWAHYWRCLIAMIICFIICSIIGFIIGFVMGMLGASIRMIQVVSFTIGLIIGLGVSLVPMRMILGKDFGEFRLVLISNEEAIV